MTPVRMGLDNCGTIAAHSLFIILISSFVLWLVPTYLQAQIRPLTVIGGPVPVGDGPSSLFSHYNGKLFVAQELAGTVGVVNIARRRLDTNIPVGAILKVLDTTGTRIAFMWQTQEVERL